MFNTIIRNLQKASTINRFFYLGVFYLVLTGSMSAQTTAARAEVPQTEEKQMFQTILNEVRQLRQAVERAQTNTSRLQIAVERLRRQQEQVDRLAIQLQHTQNEAEMLKSSKAEMEEQAKQMENRIQQAANEEHRQMMQAEFKEFKNNLAQQMERETQLEELQTKISAQLQSERSKLDELSNLLDSVQREMESQQSGAN